jgi:hypothetical protein
MTSKTDVTEESVDYQVARALVPVHLHQSTNPDPDNPRSFVTSRTKGEITVIIAGKTPRNAHKLTDTN